MADISQIKLPNGDMFDLVDEKSGYITVNDVPKEIFYAEYNPTTETGTSFDDIKDACDDGKYVVLSLIETVSGSESEGRSITVVFPLIQLMDMRTSESPGAFAVFGASLNRSLLTITCMVQPDPEDSSQFIEIWGHSDLMVQPELESGTNIKTINNQSILGSGNLTITGGTQAQIIRW